MDGILQALGAGFLIVLGTMIVGWIIFVTVKLKELDERLDKQNEINKPEYRELQKSNVIRDTVEEMKQETGRCKDCKYFEYDHMAKVYGMPLIVAHNICKKWGGGCKTEENGYCYMFEQRERKEEEN